MLTQLRNLFEGGFDFDTAVQMLGIANDDERFDAAVELWHGLEDFENHAWDE